MVDESPGARLQSLISQNKPLVIVGTINAYTAVMAEKTGHRALYLSGAGVANASCGLPDLGMTTMHDVLEDVRRLTSASSLPLVVDIDTGFGGAYNIARTIREMIRAGAAGVHIEDQPAQKRCGHRPGKKVVPPREMTDRIKAAVDAKTDNHFMVMARTDALAQEGLEAALERAQGYVEAGADALFPEAMESLAQYRAFYDSLDVPILANITEFGKTPLFSQSELAGAGVSMVLYPLTAFRAMNRAAQRVYEHLREHDSQEQLIDSLQTREELYEFLDYHRYERKLDELFETGSDD